MKAQIAFVLLLISFSLQAQTYNHGTIAGGAVFSPGIPGVFGSTCNSLQFDGVDDYVIATSGIAMGGNGGMSIWFKAASFGGTIAGNDYNGNTMIRVVDATHIQVQSDAGTGFSFVVPALSLNTWYNLIISRNQNIDQTKVYINGVESTSGGHNITNNNLTVSGLGRYSASSANPWHGSLYDFRAWSGIILSAADINALAAGTEPPDVYPSGIILHWRLNDGSGTVVTDFQNQTNYGNCNTTTSTAGLWLTSGNNIYYDAGAVGIGTGATQMGGNEYKLFVRKGIRTEKLKVDVPNTTWPDFVFDKNYNLPSLEETEKFIKLNQHLPGIPSAKEVEKDGIDVATNQALLLQKIEELTLIIIDQNKRIKALEKRYKK